MANNAHAFSLLKAALGRAVVPEEMRALMYARIDQARGDIARAGLTLDDGAPADMAFLAAYAEWLYSRRSAEDPKPRSLVDEIRSRQTARATGGAP